jgi:hypothetical protein
MSASTVQWSDVARNPGKVAAAVEADGVVILTRRGEPDLALMRADRRSYAQETGRVTAKMLRQLFASADATMQSAVLAGVFPWVKFLPAAGQAEFLEDFITTLDACADLDIWPPMEQTVLEWKATAAIHADPALHAALTDETTIGDYGSVFAPEAADAGEE